jgi:hypothetical protein
MRRLTTIRSVLFPPARRAASSIASAAADTLRPTLVQVHSLGDRGVVIGKGAETGTGTAGGSTAPGGSTATGPGTVVVRLYTGAEVTVPANEAQSLTESELEKLPPPPPGSTRKFTEWLTTARVDSTLSELECDVESEANWPNTEMRQVHSGHYVHVNATPLPDPYLIAVGPLARELGLTDAHMCTYAFMTPSRVPTHLHTHIAPTSFSENERVRPCDRAHTYTRANSGGHNHSHLCTCKCTPSPAHTRT